MSWDEPSSPTGGQIDSIWDKLEAIESLLKEMLQVLKNKPQEKK